MATSQFISYVSKDVPNTGATLVTTAGGTQTSIIGLSCTNTSVANTITADVYITRSGTNYYIVKGATVPVGGALVVVGGDQKLVLNASDALKANCSINTSMDVIASALVIS
jgi:hypothetical protein